MVTRGSECPFKHFCENLPCIEVLLGQRASQFALSLVITLYHFEAADGFPEIAKAEQACGIWQESARTSVLDHGGLPTDKIAEGTIADPGVLQANAAGLRPAKFGAGALTLALSLP